MDLKKMYEENQDFKDYVDRMVKHYNISVEQMLEKAIVMEYADYLIKKI